MKKRNFNEALIQPRNKDELSKEDYADALLDKVRPLLEIVCRGMENLDVEADDAGEELERLALSLGAAIDLWDSIDSYAMDIEERIRECNEATARA